MTSNYNKDDPTFGSIDLDDEYITDAWLVDQFVGNDLWSIGQNAQGQLGLGDVVHRSSPVQVGSLTNWKLVAGGAYHTVSVKTDGTLWSCGYNGYGQLGLGTVVHRSSPVQVGALTNWKQVACGYTHTVSVKTDGTLWSCGYNNTYGQLGLGDVVNRSSPVQVGLLTNWKQVSGGYYHTVAISSNDLPD